MFSRKQTVVTRIELSDETRQALTALENDLQVLGEMLADVRNTSTQILAALAGEIVNPERVVGVEPFADDTTTDGKPRQRSAPFLRRPRAETEAWVYEQIEAAGDWVHPNALARLYAGDEREFRYLKGAISTACRELYQMDKLERSDGTERGSMFRYRVKQSGR